MGLITIIIVLAIIGVLVWAVTTLIPMADAWKKLIYVVAILITLLWLAKVFGVWQYDIPINTP